MHTSAAKEKKKKEKVRGPVHQPRSASTRFRAHNHVDAPFTMVLTAVLTAKCIPYKSPREHTYSMGANGTAQIVLQHVRAVKKVSTLEEHISARLVKSTIPIVALCAPWGCRRLRWRLSSILAVKFAAWGCTCGSERAKSSQRMPCLGRS
jgi:hypothetical protein